LFRPGDFWCCDGGFSDFGVLPLLREVVVGVMVFG
jgi:hypothetical protein